MKPINGHVLIEPVPRKHSVAVTSRDTYEEIGVVVDFDDNLTEPQTVFSNMGSASNSGNVPMQVNVPFLQRGCKVYFDAWLAAKYPKPDGEFYWLVKYEDIRAIEYAEQQIPSKQQVS